ncbi:hypothetical protein CERZMDRAFT_98787 [Cercospora zeae-maydis SCOH1-5]|uniref:PARG catalytic Macro domain-containing protein n=1 Tax=Cercospora zeae-maydis SCOH1-5 TaxID=717836 RepID=A0A6A6FCJ2_9PEZI|nr:hypothetical protein CERZMDRAFT_98787 [Cercospora zeae-maydis SCOH1-5]
MPNITTSDLSAPHLPVRIVDAPSENSPQHAPNRLRASRRAFAARTRAKRYTRRANCGTIACVGTKLVSLLKPVLALDEVVITSSLWVHSSWSGHGRGARMTEIFASNERPRLHNIVADALELDVQDSTDGELPDLRPENLDREVRKLYAAFAGVKLTCRAPMKIRIPPWGCGAFGGDLGVNVQCMRMAAGLAGLD